MPDLAPLAWLGTYLVHSTLLLVCAWGLARRVRSVRAEEGLWRTALVGGLLTASLQTALGYDPLLGRLELGATEVVAHEVLGAELAIAAAPATGVPVPATPPAEEPAGLPWTEWLLGLWIAGGLGSGLLLMVAGRRLHLALTGVRPVEDPALLARLEDLRARAGLRRRVRLLVSDRLRAPIAMGTLRPRIVLPPRVESELPARLQDPVLAHELAHLARLDPLWLDLCRVLETVLFVQPLHRVARHALARCAEFRCDDRALELTGDRLGLARCLMQVARWIDGSRTDRPLPACGMAELRSPLAARVQRALEGEARREARGGWAALGVLLLTGGTFLAAPGVAAAPREPWPDALGPRELRADPGRTAQAIARTLGLVRASADELDARLQDLQRDASERDLTERTSRSIAALAERIDGLRRRADRLQTLADLWTELSEQTHQP